MEKVQKLVSYQYQHKDGYKLLLCYGRTVDDNGCVGMRDQDKRWMIYSSHSPIPVRNATWFQGFCFETMHKYVSDAGFILLSRTNLSSGFTTVYESVTDVNEPYIKPLTFGKDCFERIICELVQDGKKATACKVWRYAHGGTLYQAKQAIESLVDNVN